MAVANTHENDLESLVAQQAKVKLKVAFVIDALKVGGAEKFLISLVNNLSKDGIDSWVIVLSKDNPLLKELEPSVNVKVIPRKFKYDIGLSLKIRSFLKRKEISKVFCVDPFSFFMARWSFLFDSKITVYLSLHHTLPTSLKHYLLNFAYFRLLGEKDILVYICKFQKIYFDKAYRISQHKSTVIYNGVDTAYFSVESLIKDIEAEKLEWRRRIGISPDSKVILKVASFRPEKRHEHAVEALGILHRKYNVQPFLVFVGARATDNIYIQKLKELAASFKVEKFVHFIQMQEDVRPYLMLSDVFTLTSETETFSLSALEAMSFGLPCSLTNIGGASEMIEVGKTGSLSEPGNPTSMADSWRFLLTHEFDKEHIRQRVIKHFSVEQMIAQYRELLSK